MATRKQRVVIVGDRRRKGVKEGVEAHLPALGRLVDIKAVDLEGVEDLAQTQADLCLVFGGDGSILHVARRLGRNPIPVLGVNYGRFGFLADLAPDQLDAGMVRWLAGEYVIGERARMSITQTRHGAVIGRWLALNDVVFGREDIGGMVDVDVDISGEDAVSYAGDGLIVATPTGSSAHALAAGGPLLDPTVDAMVMVPIAPHSLATRPVVLSGRQKIEVSTSRVRGPVRFTVDGAPSSALTVGCTVSVEISDAPLRMIRVCGGPFFETLREKLGWRGRPYYRGESPSSGAESDRTNEPASKERRGARNDS